MFARMLLISACLTISLGAQNPKELCKAAGRLANSVTGEPVRRAKVSLHPEDPAKTVYTVNSDGEGKFHFDNIDPGRYTLAGEKEGFVEGWYGAAHVGNEGGVIDLKPGKDVPELVVKLIPQGVIAGRVLNDDGEPVSGVMVMALHSTYVSGHKQLTPVFSGMPIQTNDLGEYRLSALPPGRYFVHSAARKFTDFQMAKEKTQDNAPEEALIPVYFPNSPDAASASPVEVGPGAEVRGIDIRLKRVPSQTVSGKVFDATGKPVKTGVLMLYRDDPGVMSVLPVGMFIVQGQGDFEMRGLAPGSYNLMTNGENGATLMSVTHFEVHEQALKNLAIRLGDGVNVPVAVRIDGGDPSNIRVVLENDENPLSSMTNAQIGKDAKGLLKSANPGIYKLVVSGAPAGYYLRSATLGARDVLDTGLDLRNGAVGTLELTFAKPAAELAGVVRNDKDELVPGATVTLIAKDPKFRADMAHTTTTDQNGRFQFSDLVPAAYRVYAWQEIESGAAEDEEFRKPYEKFGAGADLTQPSTAPVSLTLIKVTP